MTENTHPGVPDWAGLAEAATGPLAYSDRPVLLPFSDDSTLFFALRMRDCLRAADPDIAVSMGWLTDESALSDRQMSQLLPEGPDLAIRNADFAEILPSGQFRAVLTCRVFRGLGGALRDPEVAAVADRACVIGFLGGLDFFPETGYFRRRNCDGVYLFPSNEIPAFKAQADEWEPAWRDVGFGHPSFLQPQALPKDALTDRKDIYFFAQALSPSTKRGRMHILRALAAMARAYPDRRVWIKLRHLPDENQNHLHREKYDYPSLMSQMSDLPSNLNYTACTMNEALATAAFGITCTSTAAIDVVREGVPCMVHLDFVDNYMDGLVEPMRRLFASSGLITSLEDMLHLRARAPDPVWVNSMFCPRDLGNRVLETAKKFRERPVSAHSSD